MTHNSESSKFCWELITCYAILNAIEGFTAKGGILTAIRSYLWTEVEQYANANIQIDFYSHIHGLSFRWHLEKQIGEVLNIMDRGIWGMNRIIYCVLFDMLPALVDIIIAVIYFNYLFHTSLALIVLVTILSYVVLLLAITPWRIRQRSFLNSLDDKIKAKSTDALTNFETVKCCSAERYEVQQYCWHLAKFHGIERRYISMSSILNTCLDLIVGIGILSGSLLTAYFITYPEESTPDKNATAGDFVLFGSYISRVFNHLCWLGTSFQQMQSFLTDITGMLRILDKKKEVVDTPDATVLHLSNGKVEFNGVSFYYSKHLPILKGVTFQVEPGQTVAIVGPSGSGKSTIIKLLLRLYDVQGGLISIEGRNVAKVTKESLRRSIGLVPQDTTLFNETVQYNIRYGRFSSSLDEIVEAAKKANIHERIMSFPDGYDTVVGERGLQLSGGEKQRIAIARAILGHSRKIILLDEATSSLDTQTEMEVKETLDTVCKETTTLVVAHRLATVVNADKILVLENGFIVEEGSHDDLLKSEGVYARMWVQQTNLKQK